MANVICVAQEYFFGHPCLYRLQNACKGDFLNPIEINNENIIHLTDLSDTGFPDTQLKILNVHLKNAYLF